MGTERNYSIMKVELLQYTERDFIPHIKINLIVDNIYILIPVQSIKIECIYTIQWEILMVPIFTVK